MTARALTAYARTAPDPAAPAAGATPVDATVLTAPARGPYAARGTRDHEESV